MKCQKQKVRLLCSVFLLCTVLKSSLAEDTNEDSKDKFVGNVIEVKSEHIDYVLIRMKHLLLTTPSNIAEIQPILANELNSSTIYKSAWDEATDIFGKKKAELVNPDYPVPDEYHIALIAYTLHDTPPENPFYSNFNKLTRELCNGIQIEEKYPYKTFFKLLTLAIDALNKNPLFQSSSQSFYRGAGIGFDLKSGQQIAFQHFLSTTTSLKKAEEFSSNTTVFEFRGPIPNSISMIHHSKFPEEEELLVEPIVVYQVESIHRGSYYTRFVLDVSTDPVMLFSARDTTTSGVNSSQSVSMFLFLIIYIFITFNH